MDQRIYHGNFKAIDLARSLIANFNRGNLQVQQVGSGEKIAVQIATTSMAASGGQTALSVILQSVPDGVAIQVGQQAWLGVAASLGMTALAALRNPWTLIGRLDDLAQDIENLQLTDEVWRILDTTARSLGTGMQLSNRLRRLECSYCGTANPVGEPNCIACGAPLGNIQPFTCPNCGFVITRTEKNCPNCKRPL
jgi:hypothetical protein